MGKFLGTCSVLEPAPAEISAASAQSCSPRFRPMPTEIQSHIRIVRHVFLVRESPGNPATGYDPVLAHTIIITLNEINYLYTPFHQ